MADDPRGGPPPPPGKGETETARSSVYKTDDKITKGPTGGPEANSGLPPGGGDLGGANVYGCIDPSALNYNPLANISDGSCEYAGDVVDGEILQVDHGDGVTGTGTVSVNLPGDDVIVVTTHPIDDTIINDSISYESVDDCESITETLCVEGQTVYEDSTSSTGFRSCNDCSEVSPVFHPDSETIYGDPIVLIPTNVETEFTGQFHQPMTISFNEQAKGWVSFKTFYPEQALSINNHYYTYSDGSMWQHHINPRRNNFYEADANSVVDIIFNDAPSSVKGFQTIKYEGSQSRINKFTTVVQDGVTYTDKEYYNLWEKCGWYVSYAETDLQTGKVPEFLNREGKWFNVIKGDCTTLDNLDEQEFSVQGLGYANITHSDPSSINPDPIAIEDPIEDPREDPREEPTQDSIINIIVKDSSTDVDGTNWD